jgi:chromate reductase, NAD(P)H dehydrogenase (quinone)
MSQSIRILGIAGSLRRESYNRAALKAATQLVPQDASLEVFELDGIPGFNQDEEKNPPAKVVELKRRVRDAHAILIVTPEYNYSVPGVLKNAIDWASRPYGDSAWAGKPVAIMGASIGTIARRERSIISGRVSSFQYVSGESARSDDRQCRRTVRLSGKPQGRDDEKID